MYPINYFRRIGLIIKLSLFSIALFSQGGGDDFKQQAEILTQKSIVIPPSAEPSELAKYNEYKVNTYTGVPAISVPITSIGGTEVTASISLSYNASGIKVADAPTIVGTGWSLNGVPTISRSVIGDPDTDFNYFDHATEILNGFQAPGVHDFDDVNFMYAVASGDIETQPDMYHFTLLDRSGKFYITPDKTIYQKEYSDLDIEVFYSDGGSTDPGDVNKIIIIDEYSRKYTFDIQEITRLEHADINGTDSRLTRQTTLITMNYTSALYASRVESLINEEFLTYLYTTDSTEKPVPVNYDNYKSKFYKRCSDDQYDSNGDGLGGPEDAFIKHKRHIYNVIYNLGNVQVEKLSFDVQEIGDSACAVYLDDKKLNSIIYSRNLNDVKKWVFNFDCSIGRLTLNSVQEFSMDNSVSIPKYSFEYYTGVLPDYLSDAIDHWGYYNGTAGVLPTYDPNTQVFNDSNRDVDQDKVRIGTLNKITYPTGGYTTFDFGSNLRTNIQESNSYIPWHRPNTLNPPNLQTCSQYGNDCCQAINGEPLTSMVTSIVYISQEMIDDAYWKIQGISYDCVNGNYDPGAGPNSLSLDIKLMSLDENTTYIEYDDPPSNVNSYVTWEKFSDLLDINLPGPGAYKIRMEGYQTLVKLFWEELITSTSYVDEPIAGLRINSIKTFDKDGSQELQKDYNYNYSSTSPVSSVKLFSEPNYTNLTSFSHFWYPTLGGGVPTYDCETITILSNSSTELGAVNGSPLGYSVVEESIVTDFSNPSITAGSTVYFYHNPSLRRDVVDPVENGKIERIQIKDANGNKVRETKYGYTCDDGSDHKQKLFYGFTVVPSQYQDNRKYFYYDGSAYHYTADYDEVVGAPQIVLTKLKRKAYKIYEQLYLHPTYEETTDYFYDVNGNQTGSQTNRKDIMYYDVTDEIDDEDVFQIKQEETTNSDGTKYISKFFYPNHIDETTYEEQSNYADVKSNLRIKNRILPAWWTETHTSKNNQSEDLIDGQKVLWDQFDSEYFPATTFRYESTYDEQGDLQSDGWNPQYAILAYDNTTKYPSEIRFDNWSDSHVYTYNSRGKMLSKTFKSFNWIYAYGTKDELQSITDIDGQLTTYEYDGLLRLEWIRARNNNLRTNFIYDYPDNKITTKQEFTGLPDRTSVQEFDGLGRPIIVTKKNYNEQGQDVVSTTTYNNRGLLETQSDFDGNVTTTTYYPDPLGRKHTVTDPMDFVTTYEYGANQNEVSGYTADELFMQKVISPQGLISQSFTDKRGRVVMSRQSDGTTHADTYTQYDDKDRPIMIIPPDATDQDVELTYTYSYDGADNMLSKKFPDQGAIEYRYDNRDLQIGMKDALMTANSKDWMVSMYDDYGRLVESGFGSIDANNSVSMTELLITNFYDGNGTANTDPIYIGKMDKTKTNILNGYDKSNDDIEKLFALDQYGRIDHVDVLNPVTADYELIYQYDMSDNITWDELKAPSVLSLGTVKIHVYDSQGRLDKTHVALNGEVQEVISDIEYDNNDQVVKRHIRDGHETLEYTYNANQWLTNINLPETNFTYDGLCQTGTPPAEMFDFNIFYNQSGPVSAPVRQDGNISGISWQQGGYGQFALGYTYDYLSRITNSTSLDNNAYGTEYGYRDKRGNISSIKRYGYVKDGDCYTSELIDDLGFSYEDGTNRLSGVADTNPAGECPTHAHLSETTESGEYGVRVLLSSDGSVSSDKNVIYKSEEVIEMQAGFEFDSDGTGTFLAENDDCPDDNKLSYAELEQYGFIERSNDAYAYDANGNLTINTDKELTLKYNHLNLPYEAVKDMDNKIEWIYAADGTKIKKMVTTDAQLTVDKKYIENIETEGDETIIYHSEGRVVEEDANREWEYNIKDHLGNVRLVYTDSDGNGELEILQNNNYYPFGMQMSGEWGDVSTSDNDYKYNGKELHKELGLGWQSYGARMYDSQIGRFTGVDPISDQFAFVSTFNYAENSPVANIDLWGLQKMSVNDENEVDFTGSGIRFLNSISLEDAEVEMQAPPVEEPKGSNSIPEGFMSVLSFFGSILDVASDQVDSESQFRNSSGKVVNKRENFKITQKPDLEMAKMNSKILNVGGTALSAVTALSTFKTTIKGEHDSNVRALGETTSALISLVPGVYSAAWGIGWEMGRIITQGERYQKFKLNLTTEEGYDGLLSTPNK